MFGGVRYFSAAILIRKEIPFVTGNVISDPNGRYVIVVSSLFGKQVILVNIYDQNFDDCNFFSKVFGAILSGNNHALIMGGRGTLIVFWKSP